MIGDDVVTTFDPAQGSFACLQIVGDEHTLSVLYGPFGIGRPQSSLRLRVSAVGEYVLGTDSGIELSYSYRVESAGMWSFGTENNQQATGAVDVVALPIDGGRAVEMAAQGEIAGWQFDLWFAGVVAPPP